MGALIKYTEMIRFAPDTLKLKEYVNMQLQRCYS